MIRYLTLVLFFPGFQPCFLSKPVKVNMESYRKYLGTGRLVHKNKRISITFKTLIITSCFIRENTFFF